MVDQARRQKDREFLRQRRRAVLCVFAAALLFAAAVLVWVFRGRFNTDGIRVAIRGVTAEQTAAESFTYDAGAGQVFASVGKGLAIATTSGFELLDESGALAAGKLVGLDVPAIAACDSYAAVYSVGGGSVYVAFTDGTVTQLDTEGAILSVSVSKSGHMAIVSEAAGYKAQVAVYDETLFMVYRWSSSSAWVSGAAVSPDGTKMAVLSYTAEGSEVRLFALTKDEQLTAFTVSGTLLLDMRWFGSGSLAAFSQEQAFFFTSSGSWTATYDFGGQYLAGYSLTGDGFLCFALSPFRSGSSGTLVTVDSGGTELGSTVYQSELISLSAKNSEVLALCADGATLYSAAMAEKGVLEDVTAYRAALLRGRGEALLLASNFAERYTF